MLTLKVAKKYTSFLVQFKAYTLSKCAAYKRKPCILYVNESVFIIQIVIVTKGAVEVL